MNKALKEYDIKTTESKGPGRYFTLYENPQNGQSSKTTRVELDAFDNFTNKYS